MGIRSEHATLVRMQEQTASVHAASLTNTAASEGRLVDPDDFTKGAPLALVAQTVGVMAIGGGSAVLAQFFGYSPLAALLMAAGVWALAVLFPLTCSRVLNAAMPSRSWAGLAAAAAVTLWAVAVRSPIPLAVVFMGSAAARAGLSTASYTVGALISYRQRAETHERQAASR